MNAPIIPIPDDSQKHGMEVNEHVLKLAVKRLEQGITPAESLNRLIEQGFTKHQAESIVQFALNARARERTRNTWLYAGIGLMFWIFGAAIRVGGFLPTIGPLTLLSDIAGLVLIGMSIRSWLSNK